MSPKNLSIKTILGFALGSEIFYLVIAGIENLRTQIPLFFICYAVIFLFYLAATALFFDIAAKQKKTEGTFSG